MHLSDLVIWLMTLGLGAIAYYRPGKLHIQGLRIAKEQAITLLPRIIMALLVSGFMSVLISTDLVAASLGEESGIKGILIASIVGGLIPGGPIISFPIVVILYKTGAAIPPLIALVTSWAIFAIHRLIAYEIPMLGLRFAAVRILSSMMFPPLTGILASIIMAKLPIGI